LHTSYFQLLGHTDEGPMDEAVQRASVARSLAAWILTGTGLMHPQQHEVLMGLDALLHSTFAKEWQWKVNVVGRLKELKQVMAEGFGYAVSNGSYHELAGLAAWIIEGRDSSHWLIGTIHTPGVDGDHSAFEAKQPAYWG